jgi:hypothetical protein
MSRDKATNPFYVILVVAGVVFCLTACAYGVMTVRGIEPDVSTTTANRASGLMAVMDKHGMAIMSIELIVLAIATVAAIATDQFWSRRTLRRKIDADRS